MILTPYTSIGSLRLGATKVQIISEFGEPEQVSSNSLNDLQLEYPGFVARLNQSGSLEEVSANLTKITIVGNEVPFQDLANFIKENDPDSQESLGFILSSSFGIAFDPLCPCWVSVFTESRYSIWASTLGLTNRSTGRCLFKAPSS